MGSGRERKSEKELWSFLGKRKGSRCCFVENWEGSGPRCGHLRGSLGHAFLHLSLWERVLARETFLSQLRKQKTSKHIVPKLATSRHTREDTPSELGKLIGGERKWQRHRTRVPLPYIKIVYFGHGKQVERGTGESDIWPPRYNVV